MPFPLTKFFPQNCPNVEAILDSEHLIDGFLVLVPVPLLQGMNNSFPAVLVVDHNGYAVTTNKGEHTLLAPDDFVQPDAILENKKIEAPVLFRGTNEQRWIGILSRFHQSLNNNKKLNVVEAYIAPIVESDEGACEAIEQALIKINEDLAECFEAKMCRLLSLFHFLDESQTREKGEPLRKEDESSDLDHESGAIVPVSNETLSHHTPPLTNSRCLPIELEGLHENYLSTCRVFKYQELQLAILNFSPGNLIGKGGSSRVYRGCLSDRKELAVKILKHSEEMLKEFILEIEIITSLHHKNIMSLFGFCFEGDNLLLVYDFLPKGSLEENLHGCKKDPRAFGWNERYKQLAGTNAVVYYSTSVLHSARIAYDVAASALVGTIDVLGAATTSSLMGASTYMEVLLSIPHFVRENELKALHFINFEKLHFVGKSLSSLRHEVGEQAVVFGFVGAPWTIVAYIERICNVWRNHIKATSLEINGGNLKLQRTCDFGCVCIKVGIRRPHSGKISSRLSLDQP
ncbi:hypothetical protein Nepgr_001146 [Nepenthes gracilis]|uniref:Protein kinase domain-containing protein n=1 Tax=Nepenthes gracilis TaxID=150966 RepID=A0AAD3P4S9_NEPGR|nr:hypothetical protein Nepgr_001146 [Nepenthes gracilis]